MTHYCTCETPIMDIDHDAGCRRCGLPVDFTPRQPSGVRISITLADGTTYSRTYPKLPRYWKSRAMDLAPYGTDMQGATFKRERI